MAVAEDDEDAARMYILSIAGLCIYLLWYASRAKLLDWVAPFHACVNLNIFMYVSTCLFLVCLCVYVFVCVCIALFAFRFYLLLRGCQLG